MSTPVVLVAGLHPAPRAAVVDRLLRDHPGAAVVRHETPADDLLPRLARQPDTPLVVVDLGDGGEPRPAAEALDRAVPPGMMRLTGALTALDAAYTPIDLTRGDRLPGDRRCVAGVLARQIEYATALVLHGGDAEDHDLSRAVLGHLAPTTPVHTGSLPCVTRGALDTRELAERVDPATARLPCPARTGGVTTVVWRRLRPLHPARLFGAVDELVSGSVRSRGRFWLATRHERMLAWEAAGGVASVEDAGPWLAAGPETAWDRVSPARRAAAMLDWDPMTGDRVQHLVFTGPDLDHRRIHALLDACLLTQEETLAGSDAWAGYDDPFAPLLDLRELT